MYCSGICCAINEASHLGAGWHCMKLGVMTKQEEVPWQAMNPGDLGAMLASIWPCFS